MTKAILWDNDGVLVDTEELYFEATQKVLADAGIGADTLVTANWPKASFASVLQWMLEPLDLSTRPTGARCSSRRAMKPANALSPGSTPAEE